MDSLYRDRILEHYKQPHNEGDLDDPDLEAEGENPSCGDELTLQATTTLDGDLDEVRFTGDGCALSIAAASLLSEELHGMGRDAVKNISTEHVFELLGLAQDDVSPMRHKCVLLARDTAQRMVDTE